MAQNIKNAVMNCSIRTTPKMHEIRSTIENVSSLPFGTKVIGPDFYFAPECICCIAFEKDGMYLRVYICNKSDVEMIIKRTIILFDCNYIKLHEERDAIFTLFNNNNVDVIGIVSYRSIYDTLTNDTLIIDLSVSIQEILTEKRIHHFVRAGDPGRKLKADFKTMLENPINADVSLHVGDERISAHWSVLCSRSPYFKKMFDIEMLEREQNSVTITDVSLCTLKKLIEFLYTADFANKDDDLEELFDLYYAADKYEVMDLRTLCAYRIMNNATPDNACQILQFAHSHNDNGLKMETMDFIKLQSEAVFQTEGWKKFEASEPLAAYVLSFRFNQK